MSKCGRYPALTLLHLCLTCHFLSTETSLFQKYNPLINKRNLCDHILQLPFADRYQHPVQVRHGAHLFCYVREHCRLYGVLCTIRCFFLVRVLVRVIIYLGSVVISIFRGKATTSTQCVAFSACGRRKTKSERQCALAGWLANRVTILPGIPLYHLRLVSKLGHIC